MTSFLLPAHVAGLSSHTRAVIVKAFWNKSALGRGRVLQDITGFNRPRTNPVRIQSVAVLPFGDVIATGFSRLWRKLARPVIEQTQTHLALTGRPFLQHGRRWISNFGRLPYKATGKPFLLRSLLKHRQEPSCVDLVLFSPNLSSVAFHGEQHGRRTGQSAVKE